MDLEGERMSSDEIRKNLGISNSPKKARIMILTGVVFFLLLVVLSASIRRVPAGNVGVYTNGMSIGTQKDSGWVFKNPLSTMTIVRYNTQSVKETVIVTSVEEDGSGYNVPMDFQVVYNLEKEKVGDLIVENPDFIETKIIQRLRSRVRQIIAENRYSGIQINTNKSTIQKQVDADLKDYLKDYYIEVQEVSLRNIELPFNVQQASQLMQQSEIEIKTARNNYLSELEVVKKKIANANADYNVTVITANATAQRMILEAEGRAESIRLIQEQFGLENMTESARTYLQYLFMSALTDPDTNVQFFIVPVGEDGMPMILDMSSYENNTT